MKDGLLMALQEIVKNGKTFTAYKINEYLSERGLTT